LYADNIPIFLRNPKQSFPSVRWEVEWRGRGVIVGVAYKNISRKGHWTKCGFRYNENLGALDCENNSSDFMYKSN